MLFRRLFDRRSFYGISVDHQYFFPDKREKKSARRRLDTLLDGVSDAGLRVVTATAREIYEVEKAK